MERLTSSNEEIKTLQAENAEYWLKVYFKLKEYEDAEEHGVLIRFPMAKGDAFWEINTGTTPASCYKRYAHLLSHCVYALERLGKTCFLTREEAEAALERMG